MYDLLVIGAGASGLLAAALSAGEGLRTAVLERNNIPAKKIYATGNGHCNYLNAASEGFNESYRVLESIGISGVSDDEGRYYPRSREASSVAEALVFAAENSGAQIICDCHITDVVKTENGFKILSKDGRKFESSKLLIATGGKAGIQFGCYGEGYRWAQYLGHSLVKPIPALVPVECEEDISVLHGVRVRGRVSLYQNGELMGEDSGEIQFTKDSVSGICVMDLSREVRLGEGKQYCLSVDLFPELSEKELLDLYMSREKLLGHGLKGLVPEKMKEYIDKRVAKEAFRAEASVRAAKDLRFTLKGTKGWADAQVTSGGIPLSEIDPKTMGSKIVEGLFFAGEIIDYDGPCGGYNLGNAWRTAIAAAKGIKATK